MAKVDMGSRVLVVDDDPLVRNLVKEILTPHGMEVTEAENGEHALELLEGEKRTPKFDAVVLDIVMPGLNGLQLLTKLKTNDETSEIPVLLLTGEDKATDIITGYNQGADYYITKPFTSDQLLYGVNIILGNIEE